MTEADVMEWASEEFGQSDLGDARRTARLVRIGAAAARSPASTVSAVFTDDAELQGACDWLESPHVPVDRERSLSGYRRAREVIRRDSGEELPAKFHVRQAKSG